MPDPDTNEILWYRPNPRAILPLDQFHCSRSLQKQIKKGDYQVSFDQAFKEVMKGCADRQETWITQEFIDAYSLLHSEGLAHSVEIWRKKHLIGGVYGVSVGGAFFAESKFYRERNASKLALFHLVEHLNQRGFLLLEVQFMTDHLRSLGALEISDNHYQATLKKATAKKAKF